jgi:serine/threonine protein phosphatase PrpC
MKSEVIDVATDVHANRNVIIRSLGSRPEVEVAVWNGPLPVRCGDQILLCSDGLHDLITNEEIRDIVENSERSEACRRIVALVRICRRAG